MKFINKSVQGFVSTILFFFFIYPVTFSFMPVTTRVCYGILGIFVLFINRRLEKNYINILLPLTSILFFAIISIVINRTHDFEFISYCISQIIIWLAAIFLFNVTHIKRLSFHVTLKFVIYTILIQSLLATAISTIPVFKDFMMNLINVDNLDILEEESNGRFIGWGIAFFNAGALNGLALLFIIYLVIKNKSWNILVSAIFFSIILFTGIFLARTVLVSFMLCLFYIIISWNSAASKSKLGYFILYMIAFIFLLILLVFAFLDEKILNWAFELFLNFMESDSMTSASTERLREMYIIPSSFVIYIFGDGLFSNTDGSYYMDIDVGYLRLLYYFGVGGLLSFFIYQWNLIKLMINYDVTNRVLLLLLFLYTVVLNFKGLIDFNFILYLLYFSLHSKKTLYDS